MRRLAPTLLIAMLAIGCGENQRAAYLDTSGGTGGVGGSSSSSSAAGRANRGTPSMPLPFPLIDHSDTACEEISASRTTIYESNEPLTDLQRAGSHWVASSAVENGFVVFDDAGKQATHELVALGDLDRAQAIDSGVVVVALSASGLSAARFDLAGKIDGETTLVSDTTPYELAVGHSSDNVLTIWSTLTSVHARALTKHAKPVADAFELEAGITKDHFSAVIAPVAGSRFAVAWSARDAADGMFRTQIAIVDAQGVSDSVRILLSGALEQRAIALAPTSEGFVLLLEYGGAPLLMLLDPAGARRATDHRLLGAVQAFDLAVFNDQIVVAAGRSDHRDALRLFDHDAQPTSGWLCLNEASTEIAHAVSVYADDSGFAALYRAADGSEVLLKSRAAPSPQAAQSP